MTSVNISLIQCWSLIRSLIRSLSQGLSLNRSQSQIQSGGQDRSISQNQRLSQATGGMLGRSLLGTPMARINTNTNPKRKDKDKEKDKEKEKKGVTSIYDVIFACLALFVGLALLSAAIPPPAPTQPSLQGYATSVLIWMDSKGLLAPYVYAQDSGALSSIMSRLAPSGFRLEVYSPDWKLLWSCTSPGFDPSKASASLPYPLSGYGGTPDPKIVVLLLQ